MIAVGIESFSVRLTRPGDGELRKSTLHPMRLLEELRYLQTAAPWVVRPEHLQVSGPQGIVLMGVTLAYLVFS